MDNPDGTTQSAAFLHALRLGSPALPVGAFSYSQGLEYAIHCEWINDEAGVFEWASGILRHMHRYVDLPVLRRCYSAWRARDYECVQHWNDTLLAHRETHELIDEDMNVGFAMHRHLTSLGLTEQCSQVTTPFSYVTLFALAGSHWEIPPDRLCQTYCWSWAENQIAAAIKSFPLGQTSGQSILCRLIPIILQVSSESALVEDTDIGGSCYGMSIASMKHETQYSRLFRS